jgi:hypothetical protein
MNANVARRIRKRRFRSQIWSLETVNPILDQVLTGFILIGGADRIGEVLKWSGVQARPQAEKSSSQPIEITGKLTLESSGKDATLSAHSAHG